MASAEDVSRHSEDVAVVDVRTPKGTEVMESDSVDIRSLYASQRIQSTPRQSSAIEGSHQQASLQLTREGELQTIQNAKAQAPDEDLYLKMH